MLGLFFIHTTYVCTLIKQINNSLPLCVNPLINTALNQEWSAEILFLNLLEVLAILYLALVAGVLLVVSFVVVMPDVTRVVVLPAMSALMHSLAKYVVPSVNLVSGLHQSVDD
jgi:hypothetical protein